MWKAHFVSCLTQRRKGAQRDSSKINLQLEIGNMKHGWEIKKLGEVATFINGDRGKNYPSQNDFVKEGIPFINAGHLVDGSVDFSSMNYISEEKYEKLGSGKIWNGDLLFCLRGSLGKKAIVENLDKAAIASSLVIVRCIDIFNRYLYYYLDSPIVEDLIFQSNNGSSQSNLSAKSVASFPIPIPPLSVQSSIVSELDCINGIIEKKREQLKELDALAQSIFYDMFGDPIQNEKGWEVKKLGEVAEIIGGSTPKTNDASYWNGEYFWITPAELDGRKYFYSTSRTLTDDGVKSANLQLLPIGTVLLSSRAPIGKVAITCAPMYCNQGFKNIVCSDRLNNEYVYSFLLYNNDYLNSLGTGATFKEISKRVVSEIPIPLPPLSLQQAFAAKIEAIEKQKELVKRSIAETETLLASRMQHYFSEE